MGRLPGSASRHWSEYLRPWPSLSAPTSASLLPRPSLWRSDSDSDLDPHELLDRGLDRGHLDGLIAPAKSSTIVAGLTVTLLALGALPLSSTAAACLPRFAFGTPTPTRAFRQCRSQSLRP